MSELERQQRRWLEARARMLGPPPPARTRPEAVQPAEPEPLGTVDAMLAELTGRVRPELVIRAACGALGLPRAEMLDERRNAPSVLRRGCLFWIIFRLCPKQSLTQIATALNRDHSVLHHYKHKWPDGPPDVAMTVKILAATRRLKNDQDGQIPRSAQSPQ